MRRATDAPLTGREVQSSNSTINAFLGGPRKSWMTAGGGNVRPTPRVPVVQKPAQFVLPSPDPSDEPSPYHGQDSPVHEVRNLENPTPQLRRASQPPPQPQQQQQIRVLSQTPSQASYQPRSQLPAQAPTVVSPPGASPSVPPPQNPPQNSSLGHHNASWIGNAESGSHGAHVQANQLQDQPRKRQRTMPPSGNTTLGLKNYVPLIETHVQRSGGVQNLSSSLARPRFQLLKDACLHDDSFYVALHQLFCIWSLDRQQLDVIPEFQETRLVPTAFQILGQLIRENDGLSPHHQSFFANFPARLSDMITRSDAYRQTVELVLSFLTKLAQQWSPLALSCKQRGYPPLVDELINDLGLLSPILQGVFFTATRRNLGVVDDECGAAMERLFAQDREGQRSLSSRMNTNRPPTHNEIAQRNSALVDSYKAICLQRLVPRQGSQIQFQPQQQAHVSRNQSPTPALGVFVHSSQPSRQNSAGQQSGQYRSRVASPLVNNHHSPHIAQSPRSHGPNNMTINTGGNPYQPGQGIGSEQSSPVFFQSPVQSGGFQWAPVLSSNHTQVSISPTTPGSYSTPYPQTNSAQQGMSDELSRANAMHHQQTQQRYARSQVMQNDPRRRTSSGRLGQHYSRPGSFSNSVPLSPGQVNGLVPAMAAMPAGVGLSRQAQNVAARAGDRMFLPPAGYTLPPQAVDPNVTALHQAHLRSPVLAPIDMPHTPDGVAERYYQVVEDFAVGPIILPRYSPVSKFDFVVPNADFDKKAVDVLINEQSSIAREIRVGCLQYRVRCCEFKNGEKECSAEDWVVRDSTWPQNVFLEINDKILEVRRKTHHGKDLPIDITPYIRGARHGANHIKISMSKSSSSYGFAVEVVVVSRHSQVVSICKESQHIPADETLANIKKSLSASLDDDEISMVPSDLTIDLADPFMARIFDVPVRGVSCLHRECFDLETFLNTRPTKSKRPPQTSMVDVWKCPLCSKDARPSSLRIDFFLLAVKEKLEATEKLDVKAIIIDAEGNWRPKVEVLTGTGAKRGSNDVGRPQDLFWEEESDEEIVEQTNKANAKEVAKMQSEIVVIELDDD